MKLVASFILVFAVLVAFQTIEVSATFPTITVHSPVAGIYNTTNILVDVQTNMSANVSYVLNNGVSIELYNDTKKENRSSSSVTNFVEGPNTLKVFATDGNETSTATVSLTVDTTVPTLTIRSPEEGVAVGNPNVHFEFVPKDDVAASLPCTLIINNKIEGSTDVPSDFRGSFDKLLKVGNYTWTVSCKDSANNTVSVTRSLVVQPNCGVFVKNLAIGNNNTISFDVENTGTIDETVDYKLTVNLQKVFSEYSKLNVTDSISAQTVYSFGFGVYQIEAEAKADCGTSNSQKLGYAKSPGENTSCIIPDGAHEEIKCDTGKRGLIQCQNGLWKTYTKDPTGYCASCGHCGDGIINCGETQTDCPKDYGLDVRCDCGNKTLVIGLTPKTVQEFYDYCKGSCGLGCNQDSDCQIGYECINYACSKRSGSCAISIKNFDYTKQIFGDQEGYVLASIKNTGVLNGSVTVRFYLDNSQRGTFSIPISVPGQENGTSFYYKTTPGAHEVKLEALSNCGALDKENATVNVFSASTVPAGQRASITEANSTPARINTTIGKGSEISLSLLSATPQVMKISVKGVPEEWLDYPRILGVENDRTVRIFVDPKQVGDYNLTIYVEGKEKNFTFSSNLRVSEKPAEKKLETENIALIIVVLIAIFCAVIFLGAKVLHHSGY